MLEKPEFLAKKCYSLYAEAALLLEFKYICLSGY
jgi:hypothetical protein